MNNVVSLVPYYGGASSMVEVMRYLMESAHELGCTKLVETMSGSGVISINRKTIYFPHATLIEMDKGMGTLLKVMADSELSLEFINRIRDTPDSSEDSFREALQLKEYNFIVDDEEIPEIEIAEAQYYLSCLSRNGTQNNYKKSISKNKKNNKTVNIRKPLSIYSRLPSLNEVRRLLNGCTVYSENCFNHILDYIHDEKCLIVIDPPFLESLRSSTGQYSYEWEDVMHRLLLDVLTKESYTRMVSNEDYLSGTRQGGKYIKDKPRAKIILFGFENEMYTKALTSAEIPWYQFILEKPLLSSNKTTEDGEKELQRKSFWINFLPSDYAKTYVLELNHLRYLTPENLEENLKFDREFKEQVRKKDEERKKKARERAQKRTRKSEKI